MANLFPDVRRIGDGGPFALQNHVNRLFDEFLGGLGQERALFADTRGEWTPALDVAETDEAVVVKMEVPGVDPKAIEVSIAGDTLTIRGEKHAETEEKGRSWHRVERSRGRFERSLTLPSPIDAEKVSAECRDGVLTLELPKREEARPKSIQVTVK